MTTPSGVRIASATQSTVLWVTEINSISNGPTSTKRPGMIFMAVRQHDCADLRAVLLQVGDVGNDQINAKEFRLREHHARVDDDDFVTEPQCHHVHAEFAEAAQRNGGEGLRGLAQ